MDTAATKVMGMGEFDGEGSGAETETVCPLCQKAFDAACASCTPACPLAKGCNALTCPHCGYSFPKPTRLSALLARLFARRARANPDAASASSSPAHATTGGADGTAAAALASATLAQVRAGERVRVTGVRREDAMRLSKLAAFGIVEGCELLVRQRHPALVVEIGETTLALDGEVARALFVVPAGA